MGPAADVMGDPEPHLGIRLDEQVNLARRELDSAGEEFSDRLDRIFFKTKPEGLVGEQPVHDESD